MDTAVEPAATVVAHTVEEPADTAAALAATELEVSAEASAAALAREVSVADSEGSAAEPVRTTAAPEPVVSEDSEALAATAAPVALEVLVATEEAPADSWVEAADTAALGASGNTAAVPAVLAVVRAGNGEGEEARMCLC